jgi:hypothetical protein
MAFGSDWFKKFLSNRVDKSAFIKNTMFVLTFDEDDGASDDNKVLTILFGPDFHPKTKSKKDSTKYTHYSLLRTIEDNVSKFICLYYFLFVTLIPIHTVGTR